MNEKCGSCGHDFHAKGECSCEDRSYGLYCACEAGPTPKELKLEQSLQKAAKVLALWDEVEDTYYTMTSKIPDELAGSMQKAISAMTGLFAEHPEIIREGQRQLGYKIGDES